MLLASGGNGDESEVQLPALPEILSRLRVINIWGSHRDALANGPGGVCVKKYGLNVRCRTISGIINQK